MSKAPELPVIFKRHYDRDLRRWFLTAFFPTLAWTRDDMTCYAHVGQHGGADHGFFLAGKPCKPEEYADLLAELRGIYEEEPDAYRLKVYRKRTPQMEDARRADYRRASK